MKTGLSKKQKVTEVYYNAKDTIAEVYTHDTKLKRRLLAYAEKYPELCKQTDDDKQGGLRLRLIKTASVFASLPPTPKSDGMQPANWQRKPMHSK